MTATASALSPIGGLIRAAWDLARQHLKALSWLFLPSVLIGEYLSFMALPDGASSYGLQGWTLYLLSFLLMIWASGASLYVLSASDRLGAAEAVKKLLPKIGGLTILSIATIIAVMLGFVALVIPGFIVGTLLFFTDYAYLLEGTSIGEAFRRSAALSAGRRWLVFWRIVVLFVLLGAITFVLALLSGLLGFIGGPWLAFVLNSLLYLLIYAYMSAYGYELYRQLAS